MSRLGLKKLLTLGADKVSNLAAPAILADGSDDQAPVRYLSASAFPDSIVPEKHREVVDLSGGGMPTGVTLNAPLGRKCVLIRDKRYIDDGLTIIINPSKKHPRPSHATIEIGKVKGKLFLQIIGGHSKFSLGYCREINGHFDMGFESTVAIGDNTSAGHIRVMAARGKMSIGKDCMISGQVVLNGGIHHAIVDLGEDAASIAPQEMSMEVGDHVWICQQAYLVGRARIGSGTIVGARAVVANDAPANCLIAGNPAVVKKRNVTWARPPERIDTASQKYIDSLYA